MSAEGQDAALALSEFRREASVALARIEGDVRLVLLRSDQSEARVTDLAARLERLDGRVDAIEREQVTRADLERRSQRTVAWMGVIVAVASVLLATGTTVIVTLVTK